MRLPWRRRAKRFEQTALPHLAEVYRLARQMSDEHHAQDLAAENFRYFGQYEYYKMLKSKTILR